MILDQFWILIAIIDHITTKAANELKNKKKSEMQNMPLILICPAAVYRTVSNRYS